MGDQLFTRDFSAFVKKSGPVLFWLSWVAIVLFVIVITYVNLHNTDIGLGTKRTLDEYAFTYVTARMFDGILTLNARNFFNISFFSYGFLYFFTQMVLTIPAQLLHSYSAMLFVERCFSLVWSTCVLIITMCWVSRRAGHSAAGLLAVLLLMSMPGFVHMVTIVHPDTMMTFCLLLAFFLAADLDPSKMRTAIIVGIFCGCGAGGKIQIAIYLPFVALLLSLRYFLAQQPSRRFWGSVTGALRAGAVMLAVVPATYLLCNPFLLKAEAFKAFVSDYKTNLLSNATNHFSYILPSLSDKVSMIGSFYFNLVLCGVAVLVVGFALARRKIDVRKILPELSMLVCSIITCAYIFSTVQKTWDSYYLATFVLFVVSIASLLGHAQNFNDAGPIRREPVMVGGGILLLALIAFIVRMPTAASAAVLDEASEVRNAISITAAVARVGPPKAGQRLLTSPDTPFYFDKLGYRITQVSFISGALDEAQVNNADMLILRKDDIYTNQGLIEQQTPKGRDIRNARLLIAKMQSGQSTELRACGENALVWVFCRRAVHGKGSN